MALKIIKPGLSTSVQDLGRPGYFHLGIPIGGAMDRYAMRAANMLVGNAEGAAGLEAVFMGPEIEFTEDATVAVIGADMPMTVDGDAVEGWMSFDVKAGQTLSFGFLKTGARIYIAVSGGITTDPDLGSRSTYPIGALGGVEGRSIAAGDIIPTGDTDKGSAGKSVPVALRRGPSNPAELRVLPGLYWNRLTEDAGNGFFEDTWMVAPEADRMGYRFKGAAHWNLWTANSRLARALILRTLLMAAIPMARSKFPVARSQSCCIVMRCRAEGSLPLAQSSRRTWI